MAVDFELELVWIPVSDVDRAKRFYLEQAGFDLLVDIPNGLPGHRIVQVTPPGPGAVRQTVPGCCGPVVGQILARHRRMESGCPGAPCAGLQSVSWIFSLHFRRSRTPSVSGWRSRVQLCPAGSSCGTDACRTGFPGSAPVLVGQRGTSGWGWGLPRCAGWRSGRSRVCSVYRRRAGRARCARRGQRLRRAGHRRPATATARRCRARPCLRSCPSLL